ncbi:MAG: S8 family serine peptidase [Thermoleophilaceae bacterium]|nr:S8 family serine peptidase [Thermoleophilaceae bacterium]
MPSGAAAAGDPLRSKQYGLDIVESDAAHRVTTGQGAVVAVVDSGVRADHQDLQGRLLPGFDFVDDDANPSVGAEGDGHGTHVLGISGANSGNGIGVSSVAPGAMYIPVRVLGDDGSGSTDGVARGIDFAVARGADVINLSLGDQLGAVSDSGSDFAQAIDRALDAGVVVVAAAGNSGLPVCEQPSGQGRILCVGSVDENRQRSFFSSFGMGLGVVAPGGSALLGRDILSLFNEGASSYTELAGTSQAAPHVAGVAALLVSRGLRGQQVVNRILATASDAGLPGPDPEFGAGIVNARRAVEGLGGSGGSTGGGGSGGGGSGGPGGSSGSTGSAAVISFRRTQRIRTVLRRGVRVRCRAAGNGRCAVGVTRRGKRYARGSKALRAGQSVITVARMNPRGRAVLRRSQRRRRAIALRVRVTVPGATPQIRRLKLLP